MALSHQAYRLLVLAAVSTPLSAPGATVEFLRTDYLTGHAPLWLASADFNRDGNLDLAVTCFSQTFLNVFLGNGAGGFQRIGDVEVGIGPWGLVEGDFNEDGNPDLVATNTLSNDVSVVAGDGMGGFVTSSVIPVGTYPRAVLSADFNEDQNLDMAVTNLSDDTISILFGNGLGGFTNGPLLPSGDGPGQGGRGDFNEDGHDDFAVGNQNSDDVNVWFGNGGGAFADPLSLPVVRHAHGAVVGRVDLDAHDDIVADNNLSNPPVVSVILGDGSGGFSPTENHANGGWGPTHVAIADLDRNGLADLAVANRDTTLNSGGRGESISILSGDGAGGFGPPQNVAVPLTPQCVLAADFDEDGVADLAVSGFWANRLCVLLNRTVVTGIEPAAVPEVPVLFLDPVSPNPMRVSATIGFRTDEEARVLLRVVDAAGRPVQVVVDWVLPRGVHTAFWDGRNRKGRRVGSGIYFLQLMVGEKTASRKIVAVP